MNRRQLFRAAAASAATAAMARCRTAPARRIDLSNLSREACALPPVRVSADREIRTVTGLRPFRPSGFLVRVETVGSKTVIHNYGHGGGGITLSWGTAKLAVDLIPAGFRGPVAVLGCGAVGLATARLLQERGYAVTIYTKDLPPNTTSNIAGGQWFPFLVYDHQRRTPEFSRQFVAAAEFAYRRYQILANPKYGVRWIHNYYLTNDRWPDNALIGPAGPLAAFLPAMRDLAPNEHPFSGFSFVRRIDGMLIEPPIYLAAMLLDVRAAGGAVRVIEIADRDAVRALAEEVVFNCTGLGAKAIFGDDELIPVKGQLTFLLPQPEVDYAALHGDYYMFPRSDGILLGGTHERDVWSLEVDREARTRVLAGHREFFESFRSC